MPFEEAIKRAGSFEALRPHLRERRILARHGELRTWPELEVESGPGETSPDWFDGARIDPATGRVILKKPDLQVCIRNIMSELENPNQEGDFPGSQLTVIPGREACAFGLELERTPVDTLFPAPTVPASLLSPAVPASRHSGGRDPDHNWEDAAHHVDDWVAAHGPLPRNKKGQPILARAVDLMTEWFVDNDPPAPQERSIRRWIGENPRSWWGPN
jgi:hypothetical protein